MWYGRAQLIYAGMSGKNIEKQQHRKRFGLKTRLDSHAKVRLSRDQFNAYKNRSGEVINEGVGLLGLPSLFFVLI